MTVNSNEYKSTVGLDKLYYALVTQDDANGYEVGTPKYMAPTATVKVTPAVSSETQYMDNIPFDEITTEGKSDLEMELSNLPSSVRAEITGKIFDAVSGRVLDNANPADAPFVAIGFRSKKSNGSFRYYWYLKCRCQEPADEAATESDKPSPKTVTLKVSALKTVHPFDLLGDASKMDGVKRVYGDADTTNFDEANWFNAVQIPVAGTPIASPLLTSSPVDGASGVSVSTNVVLTFTNPLQDGAEKGIALVDNGLLVTLARTINADRTVVTLDPYSDLSAASDILVVVHDVMDIYGQSLTDMTISFTTA